jgi:hypothetical protein
MAPKGGKRVPVAAAIASASATSEAASAKQQRPFLGRFGQQGQHRQRDQEPVRRSPLPQPERDTQRVALRNREPRQPVQQRRAQQVQAGERQLHLRFRPRCPGYPHIRRRLGHVLQQRRLAYPGLTAHHQRPPASRPQIPEEGVKHAALLLPVQQRERRLIFRPHAISAAIQHRAAGAAK